MKFILALFLAVSAAFYMNYVTAYEVYSALDDEYYPHYIVPNVSLEKCPENSTYFTCLAYGMNLSKTYQYCHHLAVYGQWIQWMRCPTLPCEIHHKDNNVHVIREDLTKGFPLCCGRCPDLEKKDD